MELNNGQRFIFGAIKSNRIKFDTFTRYIFTSTYTRDKIVLDAACGCGFGTFIYAQEAREVWGVDCSPEAIEYAKNNFSRSNVKYICDDLVKIASLPKKYFDIIASLHTMEQTDNPEKFLDNLSSTLKDDGVIILSTQNKKIVSPLVAGTALNCNKFDFTRKDLAKLLGKQFNIKWFGQRCSFKPLVWFLVRGLIRISEKILNKKFGFYGARESYEIKSLKFWHEPKDFVLVLTKK